MEIDKVEAVSKIEDRKNELKHDEHFFADRQNLVLNPLLQHRNIKCPCGSGMKAKICCGKFRFIKQYLAMITLRYITKEMKEHEYEYMHLAYKHEIKLYYKTKGKKDEL